QPEGRPLAQARETSRDKREERAQRIAELAPEPAAPSAHAEADPAQPATRVFPAWSSAAVQALDELLNGRVDQAVATAQTLPKEQRDAFTLVGKARKEVHLLYQAAAPAIVLAKPKLSLLEKSPDLAIAGITDKGIKLSTADGSVGITAPWASLSADDHAKLRAIVVKGRYEAPLQAILVRTGLCSAEALAASDQSDPVVKTLSAVTTLKAELAQAALEAEARRKAEAELAARSARDGNGLSRERALKLIEHIRRTSHGDPQILSGAITHPTQLNGLVIISRDARLEGGSLIPNAGAVVVNTSNCPYEPRDIKGAPFVSISDQPAHTGGVKGGGRFANCIFAGAMLLDGERSASFDRCMFIGNKAAPSETRSPVVRAAQYNGCVFHDVSFAVALPIAGSIDCVFSRSAVRPCDLMLGKPVVIPAIDLDETLARSLAQLPEHERRVRLQATKAQISPDTATSLIDLQYMLDKVWTRLGSGRH
nr:hypothetical protein [Planctomycetota bacterium]